MTLDLEAVAFYSSHNDMNGIRSLVIDICSFLLFIWGSLARIHSASRVFLADVSGSCARILHFTSKSLPLWFSLLCLPNGEIRLSRLLLARCSFIRTLNLRPVSPIYFAWQHKHSISYITPDLLQSPFFPWGQIIQLLLSHVRSYNLFRTTCRLILWLGTSTNTTSSWS